MSKRSRQHVPNPNDHKGRVIEVIAARDENKRSFPDFTTSELRERRTALTNSAVIMQQMIEMLGAGASPEDLGIHQSRLPIFLAHLTISLDALKHAAGLYDRDIRTEERYPTVITQSSGLVGPDGMPL